MSNFGFTNSSTGYIDGYAFRPSEVQDNHNAAWESVKLYKEKGESVIDSVNPQYGRTVYWLKDKYKNLEPLQKLVLANGAPAPFGGVVNGLKVEVYND